MILELDMTANPVERLRTEIKNLDLDDNLSRTIGNYLLDQLEQDEVLAKCYLDRKILLTKVVDYVINKAKVFLGGKSGGITDKVVFGWVLHYVQDEDVKIPESNTIKTGSVSTPKKESKPKPKKKKEEDSGQMSLFDL